MRLYTPSRLVERMALAHRHADRIQFGSPDQPRDDHGRYAESAEAKSYLADKIKKYGKTKDIHEAGFVHPNGDMPKMSQSYPGQRTIPHEALGVHRMLNSGAIRIDSPSGGEGRVGAIQVNTDTVITSAQKARLLEVIESHDGKMAVDVGMANGAVYREGTKASKILGDINRMQRGEKVRSFSANLLEFYAPGQDRDDHGRFTGPGKGGKEADKLDISPLISKSKRKHEYDPGIIDQDKYSYLSQKGREKLHDLIKNGEIAKLASKIVDEYHHAWEHDPEIMKAKDWYEKIGPKFEESFADPKLASTLLAVTSLMRDVEQNWADGTEAYDRYKSGAFDKQIALYKAAGGYDHPIKITDAMLPRKENGKQFGLTSKQVLQVITGTWHPDGPKLPQFNQNILGTDDSATIDRWAGRTLQRLSGGGYVRGDPAVKDLDFAIGQYAFRAAAEKLDMKPQQLQAVAWYGEKDYYEAKGIIKSDKNDFSPKMDERIADIKSGKRKMLAVFIKSDTSNFTPAEKLFIHQMMKSCMEDDTASAPYNPPGVTFTSLNFGSPDQPRDDHGRWTDGNNLPAEAGSTPIPEGHVRLYHQTSDANVASIKETGLRLGNALGIEGPKAIYADEKGFYGEPGSPKTGMATIEFHVAKDRWKGPYVTGDVDPRDIVAVFESWHNQARRMESDPRTVANVVASNYEEHGDTKKAVDYIKAKYGGSASLERLYQELRFYSPDEERTPDGKWTSGGESAATVLRNSIPKTLSSQEVDKLVTRNWDRSDGGDAFIAEKNRQKAALIAGASKAGLLIDSPFKEKHTDFDGGEHLVNFDNQNVTKETLDDKYGIAYSNESYQHRIALPTEYLERVELNNKIFPEDPITVTGITNSGAIVTTTPLINSPPGPKFSADSDVPDAPGTHPTPDQIAVFLGDKGFKPRGVYSAKGAAYYNPETRVRLSDAEPRNFLTDTAGKIHAVDVIPSIVPKGQGPFTFAAKRKIHERTNDTRAKGATNTDRAGQEKRTKYHTGGVESYLREIRDCRNTKGRIEFYAPGQDRDDHGKFAGGGISTNKALFQANKEHLKGIYGGNLKVYSESEQSRLKLNAIARLPDSIHKGLAEGGVHVYIGDSTVTAYPPMAMMSGVTPRGWGKGETWDTVAGAYDSDTKSVIAGSGEGENGMGDELILHEMGHAFGQVYNVDNSPALKEAYSTFYHSLTPSDRKLGFSYFVQGGSSGKAGREESLAESFKDYYKHGKAYAERIWEKPMIQVIKDKRQAGPQSDLEALRQNLLQFYSPDQPRDDHGRWGSGAGVESTPTKSTRGVFPKDYVPLYLKEAESFYRDAVARGVTEDIVNNLKADWEKKSKEYNDGQVAARIEAKGDRAINKAAATSWMVRQKLEGIYGDQLGIYYNDTDDKELALKLAGLGIIPDAVNQRISDAGFRLVLGDKPVSAYSSALQGVMKDAHGGGGWPEGSKWDEVAGVVDYSRNQVILGSVRKNGVPPDELVLHEMGHAFGAAYGVNDSPSTALAYYDFYDRTSPVDRAIKFGYFTQGGRDGATGRHETIAESFKDYHKFGKAYAEEKWGAPMVNVITTAIKNGPK